VNSLSSTPAFDVLDIDQLDIDQLDVDQLRADTRGCSEVIHLNNAGSALPPAIVVDTMVDFLRQEEMQGGYEAHATAQGRLDNVYTSIATLLATEPTHIALTESATSSWDRAFASIAFTEPFTSKSRILVSSSEYASNVLPIMQIVKRTGATLEFIADSPEGVTDLDSLEKLMDESVALVAINHCPSQNGLINDVAGIGEIIRSTNPNTWYLVDACQSVGQLSVDAPAIGADFLSVTGRKFMRGPRGTGFLYCSSRTLAELEPFPLDLHGGHWDAALHYSVRHGARRFESWEKSYAALLGLGAAVDYSLALGMSAIELRITELTAYARNQLATIAGVRILDRGESLSGIVTFLHETTPAAQIVERLRAAGINVSLGTPDYSQVDYLGHGVEALIRVSPHVYNTTTEIDTLVETVRELTA
jgi:selenocysteine lyase/cysteine desulfurase